MESFREVKSNGLVGTIGTQIEEFIRIGGEVVEYGRRVVVILVIFPVSRADHPGRDAFLSDVFAEGLVSVQGR